MTHLIDSKLTSAPGRKSGARLSTLLCVAAALCAAACTVDTPPVETRDQDLRVSLFHTTDWHSRVLPYNIVDVGRNDQNLGLLPQNNPFGGAARLATLLKCARIKDIEKIPVEDRPGILRECCCLQPGICGPAFKIEKTPMCCTRNDGTCDGCETQENGAGNCASDPGVNDAPSSVRVMLKHRCLPSRSTAVAAAGMQSCRNPAVFVNTKTESCCPCAAPAPAHTTTAHPPSHARCPIEKPSGKRSSAPLSSICLLYTSDAADE